eukprot:Pompholyxophrys_punicea_v1_NODE_15_length_6209_cov_7.334416.p3 type:complete len:153 gc:universal NODE_15_length_6209_cov_7.334416:3640-4098(+)
MKDGKKESRKVNSVELLDLHVVSASKMDSSKPYQIVLQVQGNLLDFQIDTGAAVSIVNRNIYDRLLKELPLTDSFFRLRGYDGKEISIVGICRPVVKYKGVTKVLELVVVDTDGPALLGRNWMEELTLNWKEILFGVLALLINKRENCFGKN